MRQNYDFKIDKIKDLTPEEISLRKKVQSTLPIA